MNQRKFCQWELASRDTIDVKRVYIDMAGDLVAGVLFSQIMYWHLPGKTGQTKLRVQKGEHLWLAKRRSDWWDEARISPKQFDRAIKLLEERGLIQIALHRFNGAPTKHVRIDWPNFLAAWDTILMAGVENPYCPKVKNGTDLKVQMDIAQEGITITKTTSEITSKTTSEITTEKEPKDFLSQTKKSHRERIRDILSDALDTPVPASPLMVKKWDAGIDSIVVDCRAVVGKKRLDAELASQIIAAIRLGVETDEWALLKADFPNVSVIGCIPRLLREYQDKLASQSTSSALAELSQAALAERQAERTPATPEEIRWGHALEELEPQMGGVTFQYLFGNTRLRSASKFVAVVEVGSEGVGVREKLEFYWGDRVAAALGIESVRFEGMPVEQLDNGVLED